MRHTWQLVGVALLIVLLRADVAHAHSPALLCADQPYAVTDATVSRALYGVFHAPDQVFVITMHPATRIALPFEILVPHRDELRDHRPAYAIVARGLPRPSPDVAAHLPRPLPDGAGVFIDWNDAPTREVEFESFLRRVYWSSGTIAVLVPAGDVEIWVWSPRGTTGKFVLGFGVEEGGIDYGDVLDHWSDYAY